MSKSFPAEAPQSSGDALSELMREVFNLSADLISTGDLLIKDLGLTSARWQVLAAVAHSPVMMPVAHLARTICLSRQAVQRVVDDLVAIGMVRFQTNPNHRRAMLVKLTPMGEAAFRQADSRLESWSQELAVRMSLPGIISATELLRGLRGQVSDDHNDNIKSYTGG